MFNLTNLEKSVATTSINTLLGGDERLLQFLFHHKNSSLRLPAEDLLVEARSFSHSDYLLICLAIDLWCGQSKISISEAVETLEEYHYLNFLAAMSYRRGFYDLYEAVICFNE